MANHSDGTIVDYRIHVTTGQWRRFMESYERTCAGMQPDPEDIDERCEMAHRGDGTWSVVIDPDLLDEGKFDTDWVEELLNFCEDGSCMAYIEDSKVHALVVDGGKVKAFDPYIGDVIDLLLEKGLF